MTRREASRAMGSRLIAGAEGHLKSAGATTYTYDGDGQRVEKSTGKLYWYGGTGLPVTETDLAGNNPAEYVLFGGERIARRDSSGHVNYYLADALGSSRVVTDPSGNILDDSDFYPFGGERSFVGPTSGNTYKFTGKERDSETGNDYFTARYYGSSLGRFISPDPLGGDITIPQSLNRYAYVMNNPTNLIDPSGLEPGDPCERHPNSVSLANSKPVCSDSDSSYWATLHVRLALSC